MRILYGLDWEHFPLEKIYICFSRHSLVRMALGPLLHLWLRLKDSLATHGQCKFKPMSTLGQVCSYKILTEIFCPTYSQTDKLSCYLLVPVPFFLFPFSLKVYLLQSPWFTWRIAALHSHFPSSYFLPVYKEWNPSPAYYRDQHTHRAMLDLYMVTCLMSCFCSIIISSGLSF